MTIYGLFAAAIILAQLGCIADMLLNGRTIRMPVAGGALTVMRRAESRVGFYAMLLIWVVLFVGIDLIVFWPSLLAPA